MYQYPDPTDYGDPRFHPDERDESDEYACLPLGHGYTPPPAMNGGDRLMFPMSRWVPPYGLPAALPRPLNEHHYISPTINERGWEIRRDMPAQATITYTSPVATPSVSPSPPPMNSSSPKSRCRGHGLPGRNHKAVQFLHQYAPPTAAQNTTRPGLENSSNMQQSLDSIEKSHAHSSSSLRKIVLLQQAQTTKKPPVGMMTAGPRWYTELPNHAAPIAHTHHGTSVVANDSGSTTSPSPSAPISSHEPKVATPSTSLSTISSVREAPPSPYLPLRLRSNESTSESDMLPEAAADVKQAAKRVHFLEDPVSDFHKVTRLPRSHFGQLNASAPMGAPIEDDEVDEASQRIGGRVLRKRK